MDRLENDLFMDDIISPRGEVWAHKTSLTPPLFVKVPVTSHEGKHPSEL